MIERKAFYVITCDECGERLTYDEDYGFAVLETWQEVGETIQTMEWEMGPPRVRSMRERFAAALRRDIIGTEKLAPGRLTCQGCVENRAYEDQREADDAQL